MEIARLEGLVFFQPLYFASKEVCDSILEESKVPIWEGYSRGLQRTACRICPGQKPIAYTAIRENFPDVWAELLALEERLGPGCWRRQGPEGPVGFQALADHGASKL